MASSQRSDWGLYVRLSFMMFLQFAVWGAWSVMIGVHMQENLKFDGREISYVFGTTAIGAIIAPMIAGWIADRFMPNQIYTGISQIIGAILLYVAWKQTSFWGLYGTMVLYAAMFMPTLALTNAIVFHHMKDSDKFGMIRVWGTLGWIGVQTALAAYLAYFSGALPAWLAGVVPAHPAPSAALANIRSADCFLFAAVASLLLGVYCFTLPNTPPAKDAKNPYAFLEAFKLAANRNFLILLVISFVVAVELPFYYNLTLLYLTEAQAAGGVGLDLGYGQFVMTFGQWGEVLLMALLFPMMRWGGVKWTILLGILAWPVRYAIFAFGHTNPALVVAALPLHGICYAFFFAGGMIAVERIAPRDIRASAQSLMLFATNGMGMLVGHFISGQVHDFFALPKSSVLPEGGHNWTAIFMVPIVVTVVAAIIFGFMFNEREFEADSRRIKALDAELHASPAESVA